MSTEYLLKRAAFAGRQFLASEHVSALEHDLYDLTHALAADLRESERKVARYEAALRLWKCTRCWPNGVDPNTCPKCGGSGLHPFATEALKP